MKELQTYNASLTKSERAICDRLMELIDENLKGAGSKVWHKHPVWFLEGNPIVGYSKEKRGIRLMFWSGKSFDEEKLDVRGEKFMDASVFYNDVSEINVPNLKRWFRKAEKIQWDYKNIVKRKGVLERLK